jgi:mannose-1-phosphate guanylyltransferase
MLHAIIMAGGSGVRFWPLSRRARPKQFLPLAESNPMLTVTVDRCRPLVGAGQTWVVTNAAHAPLVSALLPDLPATNLLREPCGRNTAACIGLAAVHVLRQDADAVLAVLPSDHAISPPEVFRDSLAHAAAIVEASPTSSVLFGVSPTYAATGFGYIERGEALRGEGTTASSDRPASLTPLPQAERGIDDLAFHVRRFHEKPSRELAEQFLASGSFYWNCGIFVWRAAQVMRLLAELQPEIHERLSRIAAALGTAEADAVLQHEFPRMPAISIDHGVLEKAKSVCVMEAPFAWDDVGSWEAFARWHVADADGNSVDGLHCGVDTHGCIVRSEADHLVATIGLDDLLIVQTPDATLVARKDDENAIRRLVALLEERGHARFL